MSELIKGPYPVSENTKVADMDIVSMMGGDKRRAVGVILNEAQPLLHPLTDWDEVFEAMFSLFDCGSHAFGPPGDVALTFALKIAASAQAMEKRQ